MRILNFQNEKAEKGFSKQVHNDQFGSLLFLVWKILFCRAGESYNFANCNADAIAAIQTCRGTNPLNLSFLSKLFVFIYLETRGKTCKTQRLERASAFLIPYFDFMLMFRVLVFILNLFTYMNLLVKRTSWIMKYDSDDYQNMLILNSNECEDHLTQHCRAIWNFVAVEIINVSVELLAVKFEKRCGCNFFALHILKLSGSLINYNIQEGWQRKVGKL